MSSDPTQVIKCGWLSEVRYTGPILNILRKQVWCVLLGSELKCYKSEVSFHKIIILHYARDILRVAVKKFKTHTTLVFRIHSTTQKS